jgi:hypothetical protein
VVGVHQDRIVDAVGGRSDLVDVVVDGDRDDLEVMPVELVLECLPTWQIEDAASPTGERDQQSLLGPVIGQCMRRSVEVR